MSLSRGKAAKPGSGRVRKFTGRVTCAALALATLYSSTLAGSHDNGTPAESKAGTASASTYAPDKLETVNLANGNLSMSLPLATVGGRGAASYTISLSYNSKLWSAQHEREVIGGLMDEPPTYVHHYYAWYDTAGMKRPNVLSFGGGWSISLGPSVKSNLVRIDAHPCSNENIRGDTTCYKFLLTKVNLILPDGSEVELRDAATDGAPYYIASSQTRLDRNRGRVWKSSDGSGVTYVTDAPNGVVAGLYGDVASLYNGWVFLSDGTRLRMEGFASGMAARCTKIVDRNGNFVTIDYDNPQGTTYTDTLGRQVVLEASDSSGTVSVRIKGYAGVPDRVVTVNWGGIGGLNSSGVAENLREDFRSLPRPFSGGDFQRNLQGEMQHTIDGPHTDLFAGPDGYSGSESAENVDWKGAVTRVNLLDGRSIRFRYNQYGEVAEVVYPGGGVSRIDYRGVRTTMCEGINPFRDKFDRRVVARRLLTDGVNVDATWTYGQGTGTVGGVSYPVGTINAYAGDGTGGARLLSETHYFLALKAEFKTCRLVRSGDVSSDGTHYEKWQNAKGFRVERQTGTGTQVTVREWRQRAPVVWGADPNLPYNTYATSKGQEDIPNDPRVAWEESFLENGRKRRVEYGYDQFNNVTSIKEYDFGDAAGSTGPLLRETIRAYATSLNGHCYTNLSGTDGTCGSGLGDVNSIIHQRRLMLSETVKDGAGNQEAYSEIEYDNYASDGDHAPLTFNPEMIGYDGARFAPFAPQHEPRGNATRTRAWAEGTTYSTAYAHYDNAGNVVSTKDPKGLVSTVSYADNFGDGSDPDSGSAGPNGKTYALPTLATNALGHEARTQYDYSRGVPTGARDPNLVVSKTEYDLMGRPVRVTSALGVAGEQAVAETSYPTAASNVAYASRQLDAARWLTSKTEFDGFDRPVLAGSAEDGRHFNDSAVYTVFTKTVYDALGRARMATNPHRATAAATDGWTRSAYDLAGRVTEVATFAGGVSSQPPDSGTNANWTGSVVTTYAGEVTTVRDQANKQRRSTVDGLGRLTVVEEMMEHPSTVVYATTSYGYDARGNLKTVTQGQQARTFVYDGLSRLKSAAHPESGTIAYSYDPNGNLETKTDARGVTVTYGYDELNRPKTRSYAGGVETPAVTYAYDDPLVPNSKGRLTKVSSSVSETSYTEYDSLGRVTASRQVTDGQTYSLPAYAYDLAGNLISETYPSGRVVETGHDGAGRVAGVKKAAGGYYTGGDPAVPNNPEVIKYAAHGAAATTRLGNGRWEHTAFNSRLQPVEIGLGTQGTDASLLRLGYTYGVKVAGVLDAAMNNGNLEGQTITAPGLELKQSYLYDGLNRLQSAREVNEAAPCAINSVQTADCWKQTYAYDAYGNRRFNAAQTTMPYLTAQNEDSANPTISTSDNRLSSAGHRYDAAGNLECDPAHPCGQVSPHPAYYTYDAESRLRTAGGEASAAGGATYLYDGDGRRVKKVVGLAKTVFVYDAMDKLVAEYTDTEPARNGTQYLTADHLGSPKVVTDSAGNVKARHDYFPFGEELYAGTGGRTAGQGYSADSVRQKFTGYERDGETGLDFAQARMYSYSYARFTSPDPYNVILEKFYEKDSKKSEQLFQDYIRQPQNWNRYVYVWNNPLVLTDPTGEKVYVVVYTRGNYRGDEEFKRVAETHANDIRNSKGFDPKKDTVLVMGVSSKKDVQNVLDIAALMEHGEKGMPGYGKVAQVAIVSHAGYDGPSFPGEPRSSFQWSPQELASLKVNWDRSDPSTNAYFMGCNTAADHPGDGRNFAQNFANAQGVTAFGFPTGTTLSSNPTSKSYRYYFDKSQPMYMLTKPPGRGIVRRN